MTTRPSEYDVSLYKDPEKAALAILNLEERVRELEKKLDDLIKFGLWG
jgi:hypothetical protein